MLALGINFQKGRIRSVLLERNDDDLSLTDRRVIKIDPGLPLPELMERYKSDFLALIEEFRPNLIAVRNVWESKGADCATFQIMPAGILALVSRERAIKLFAYSPQALRSGGPFGLAKTTKPISAVDETFGVHPPSWDDLQKGAVLVAWRALRETA
ncbi:hypothetical protein [Rhodopseudomonas sp. B29]|uniref:hypothetical protein n=1 Tax=Rhodopseudomonas sp. B29 TaxID=95607 RepID=UPI0011D1F94C|nr:hypothetical protein [Rhodopseudomonas sp. B29]